MKLTWGELWPDIRRPLIGMLHLPPLPGSPGFRGDRDDLMQRVMDDAAALVEGGVHALMIENFGDTPFYPQRVPAITIAHMTALAYEVRRRYALPLGVNVLRNDGQSALAIAHAVGAQFIRVNVLCGARVADQGLLQSIAHDLLRERAALAARVQIWADVNVKHSAPLGERSVEEETVDIIHRGCADAVIVSGAGTGHPTDLNELERVKAAAGSTPVLVGSGVTAETIGAYSVYADGFIVGTSIKRDGFTTHPVDPARVRALVDALA